MNNISLAPDQSSGMAAASGVRSGKTALRPIDSRLFGGVNVNLDVRLGEATMSIDELYALKSGSIVSLDKPLADRVDLYLDGALVARGEIVAVGDKFGVRIVEIGEVERP